MDKIYVTKHAQLGIEWSESQWGATILKEKLLISQSSGRLVGRRVWNPRPTVEAAAGFGRMTHVDREIAEILEKTSPKPSKRKK